jgi:hypothetical protein
MRPSTIRKIKANERVVAINSIPVPTSGPGIKLNRAIKKDDNTKIMV